ncbi:type II restriction endonuclease [Campylobacter concisus]|uniref:type II restriction endonuclease n=1 Tax=Campylobacter concisus TaxID=199 RepID=UPI0021566A75|nr:type II restriction endonuclease [Campylobacter concisus]
MANISLDEYKNLVKEKRKEGFKQPYDLVYDNFITLGYDKVPKEFFLSNASEVVEKLRNSCWSEFQPLEKDLTSKMLKELVDDEYIKTLTPIEAITWFVEEFPEHIYALTLSNTQSRRSRAGKEFESIIELILIGAGIPLDSQGNIGKQEFVNKGLGKLVDLVSPGVLEYIVNKRNTVLISAKTTLRERWQEVPEEMGRTGAREMFLATLDTS